jgi:hypothetical protein
MDTSSAPFMATEQPCDHAKLMDERAGQDPEAPGDRGCRASPVLRPPRGPLTSLRWGNQALPERRLACRSPSARSPPSTCAIAPTTTSARPAGSWMPKATRPMTHRTPAAASTFRRSSRRRTTRLGVRSGHRAERRRGCDRGDRHPAGADAARSQMRTARARPAALRSSSASLPLSACSLRSLALFGAVVVERSDKTIQRWSRLGRRGGLHQRRVRPGAYPTPGQCCLVPTPG